MAITVKKAVLWRKEISNQPGTLAQSLKPLAEAGVDLQIVMGYAFPGKPNRAAVEVYPVTSSKAEQAAKAAGMKPGDLACLLVEGDNQTGLGHAIAKALSQAKINMNFAVIQVIGRKYIGVLGFDKMSDALAATPLIKSAAVKGKKVGGKAKKASKAKKTGKVKKASKIVKLSSAKKSKSSRKGKKTSMAKAAMRKAGSKKKTSKKKHK
jgi:hypothetical protein